MEKTAVAEEAMHSVRGELLAGVSDASIKMFAKKHLKPMRKGETSLGSLHNVETQRLYVLHDRLEKLHVEGHVKAELAETDEERDAAHDAAERYNEYGVMVRRMAWCQIHEDIGGYWADDCSIREDWVIVRVAPEEKSGPPAEIVERLKQAFGPGFSIGRIEIQGEEE